MAGDFDLNAVILEGPFRNWRMREAQAYMASYVPGTSPEDALTNRGTPGYLHADITDLHLAIHLEIPTALSVGFEA